MVFSVRTIFLFVRGVDQTGRALEGPSRKLTELERKQRALARTSYRLMFAGAAFATFGAMVMRGLMSTLEYSSRGVRLLGDLGEAVDRVKKAIGEEIVDTFGETISGWADTLDRLAKNEAFKNLTAKVGFTLTLGAIEFGAALTAVSLLYKIGMAFAGLLTAAGYAAQGAAVAGAAATFLHFALPIAVTLVVATIIWSIMPDAWKESIRKFAKELKEKALTENINLDIAAKLVSGGGGLTSTERDILAQYYEIPRSELFVPVENNIFIENLHTRADEDELSDVVSEAVVSGVEDAVGVTGDVG